MELRSQTDVATHTGSGKESGEGKREGSDPSFTHGAEEAKGLGDGSSDGVGANESGPEKGVWGVDLCEDKARVGVERHMGKRGDEAYELGYYIGTLVEVVAVDMSVNLFRMIKSTAFLHNSHHF